jgi:hypothetical protein
VPQRGNEGEKERERERWGEIRAVSCSCVTEGTYVNVLHTHRCTTPVEKPSSSKLYQHSSGTLTTCCTSLAWPDQARLQPEVPAAFHRLSSRPRHHPSNRGLDRTTLSRAHSCLRSEIQSRSTFGWCGGSGRVPQSSLLNATQILDPTTINARPKYLHRRIAQASASARWVPI